MAITQLALSDSVDNKKKKKLSTPHLDEEVRPPLSILVEKEKESSKKEQISPLWGNDSEFIEEGVVDTKAPVHSIKDHSSPIEAPLETKPNTRNWVYICVFAGALTGMWSPLSTLGTSGEGAVLNPYSALFLFQCGQTLGAPIYLSYSSYLFKRNEKSPSFEYPHILFLELFELPTETVLYGLACGGVVGFGFTMYFIASSVVSPAISFATAACCPLFTILLGILFGKQLSGASRLKTALLFGAVCFYIIAIVLIAASK